MKGFDPEFADIEGYILGITDRIWKDRDIEAIRRYYAPDAVIHTLGGPVVGSEAVIQSTKDTLQAFPDRRLLGEAVIWSGDDATGYYSSHRILSPDMTNAGASPYGPPTGKQATVRTIADCVVRANQVHEEWLVRDNLGLVMQLGLDPHSVAKKLAQQNRDNQPLRTWLQAELERVRASRLRYESLPDPHQDAAGFAGAVLSVLYQEPDAAMANSIYARDCEFLGPSGRAGKSPAEVLQAIHPLLHALGRRQLSIDHVCALSRQEGQLDIAVRWTLAGVHLLDGIYGPATNKEALLLAATHWRLEGRLVTHEWTVFDELALMQQLHF